jgi:uncharacterized protein
MQSDLIFYAAALPAVILTGLSKGGFAGVSMAALPLMALVMAPLQAAAIILPVLMAQDVVTVWNYRNSFDRKLLAHLLPGAFVGIGLAWLTASFVTDAYVRLAVGVIAVAFCLDTWISRRKSGEQRPHNPVSATLLGTTSGFTSFMANAGGAPFIAYALPRAATKELLAGTGGIYFCLVNIVKLPPYLMLGQFTRETLWLSATLLPVAIAANLAGIWLVRRISPSAFFRAILIITFVIGLKLIADFFWPGQL